MNDHYYSRTPQSASRPTPCTFTWRGESMRFETDAGVFSRGELDPGSRLLLDALPEELAGDLLDLGCGWGAIGVTLARHWPAARVTLGERRAGDVRGERRTGKAGGGPLRRGDHQSAHPRGKAGNLPPVPGECRASEARRSAVSGDPETAGGGKLHALSGNDLCNCGKAGPLRRVLGSPGGGAAGRGNGGGRNRSIKKRAAAGFDMLPS